METLNIDTPTDKDVAKGVRYDNPQSQFGPDGMVGQLTGNKNIDSTTTKNIHLQNLRLGKFMKELSKTDFEELQEVPQKNGDTAWVMDTAINEQDFNLYISKADILRSVTHTEVKSEEEIKEKAKAYNIEPKETYVVIDGKKYFVRMDIPMHFGTGQNSDTWINMGVFILGDGLMSTAIAAIISTFGGDAFSDVMKNISSDIFKTLWAGIKGVLTASYRFIQRFFVSLFNREGAEAALAAGRAAMGQAWSDSVEGITTKTLKYSLLGAILIVGVMLIIEFVLHESYQVVYFYNLTDYDINLEFPYKDFGDFYNLPTQDVQAKIDRKGPGDIDLGEWYNGVSFGYQSDSEFNGLGYTMRFQLKDPQTQEVKKTFSCLFDVPFDGDNSLYASTTEPSNYKDYYSTNSGENKITQYKAVDEHHEIIVTYDFLDGKHTSPETGNDVYLYSSLIIIRDVVA